MVLPNCPHWLAESFNWIAYFGGLNYGLYLIYQTIKKVFQ